MKITRFTQITGAVCFLLIVMAVAVRAQITDQHAASLPALSTDSMIYIVRLEDKPLAVYRGGTANFAATSPRFTGSRKLDWQAPDIIAYQNYLASKQAQLLADFSLHLGRELKAIFHYTAAYNGLALELTGAEATQLASFPGVLSVQREQEYEPLTDAGPTWIDAPAIWEGSVAIQNKGEGIIIGVIDTGINIDHPSFTDVGGDGYDHTNPLGVYLGWCNPTHANYDPAYICNDKLIGMWDYADVYGESGGPEDGDGHGSHTASTAAGNIMTATLTTSTGYTYTAPISGVAPHANIIAYDACVVSCPGAALLAAVNQAVIDGVDVINYSISGGTDPYNDGIELAFLAANEAGVFVAAAAGNSGPSASTLSHHSPWVTTVGANSHNRRFNNTLINLTSDNVGALADVSGKSVTAGYGPAPLVYAGDYGDALCLTAFAPGTWTNGEIVVCDRGVIARVTKGSNVQIGGAGGLILANTDVGQSVNADVHIIPAVHINVTDGDVLRAWLASGSGHMGTIAGTTVDFDAVHGDVMAPFSSRGPNTAFDTLKPDIVGPGLDVLAAVHTTDPLDDPEFGLNSGTSMAAPHLAGAAALLLGAHLTWLPDEVRSAMMMTAVSHILLEDGAMPATPFDSGSGRIDLGQAVQAGLVLSETRPNYEAANPALGGNPQTLNLPSMVNSACLLTCSWTRTVKNSLTVSTTWTATVDTPPGMSAIVTPTTFMVAPGMTQTLDIQVDVTGFYDSQGWAFAALHLGSPGQVDLHMPIAVIKVGETVFLPLVVK